MKLKAIGADYTAISKLMLVVGVFLIFAVVFSLLNFGIAFLFYGVTPDQLPSFLDNLSDPFAINLAKVLQLFSSIGFFILPSFVLAWLFSNRIKEYLQIDKGVNKYTIALAVIVAIVAIPFINYLGDINSRMYLPQFLSGVEKWMRDYEGKAQHLTESFLKMETPGDLIFNIVMIGLLPAIGEELFFRGILQRICIDWTKSKHWGIWITAIIFSAIHLQFFGFVPRLLLGAMLGYLFVWSGSLWLPIIVHFVNNATSVILTYCYSSDLFSVNPNNIGANDDSMVPVLVSVLLVALLLIIIYVQEKNNRWINLTVVPHKGGDILDYEKVLIEYFDKPVEKVIPVEQPAAPQQNPVRATVEPRREEFTVQLKEKKEIVIESGSMSAELLNFAMTDFSDEAQQEMITRMNLSYKLGSAAYHSFLNQYGFIKPGNNGDAPKPTGLGLLMLGKSPQLHFPQERIKFTIHRDKEDPIIKDFEGPLVLMPGKIEEYLDFIVSSSISREQFHRVVLSEIPKKVLREVIINAIVHRDYSIEGARIMVDAFNDRVEVSSPGIPKFPIKKFYDCTVPSVSRNQKISYIFNQMHLVEERGLGMKELKSLKDEGNPPDFKLESDIFITIIYKSKKTAQSKAEETPNLTEEAVKDFISQKRKISAGDYSKRFSVTTKTAQRHLNKLIEDGVVEKEGDKKGTKYFLKQ